MNFGFISACQGSKSRIFKLPPVGFLSPHVRSAIVSLRGSGYRHSLNESASSLKQKCVIKKTFHCSTASRQDFDSELLDGMLTCLSCEIWLTFFFNGSNKTPAERGKPLHCPSNQRMLMFSRGIWQYAEQGNYEMDSRFTEALKRNLRFLDGFGVLICGSLRRIKLTKSISMRTNLNEI